MEKDVPIVVVKEVGKSYGTVEALKEVSFVVRLMRFERTAHSVGGYCSIQLSYRRISTLYIISHSAIKCNCFL